MTVIKHSPGHVMNKFVQKEKFIKVGNSNQTNKLNVSEFNDDKTPAKTSTPKEAKTINSNKPKVDNASKKIPKKFIPAGGKPTKTPKKQVKPKKKMRKAINLSLRPNPPNPKSMKHAHFMSFVSNIKIRKLQQPMERARQYRPVR